MRTIFRTIPAFLLLCLFSTQLIAQRKDYALIFAASEYENWENLEGPAKEAEALKEVLENDYGFEVKVVNNFTKGDIIRSFRELMGRDYSIEDQVFIYFTGHGHFDYLFHEGYIICSDSEKSEEDFDSYFSFSFMKNLLDRIPTHHLMVTFNSGYGKFFDAKAAGKTERLDSLDLGNIDINITSDNELLQEKLQYRTRRFMAYGGLQYDVEYSAEHEAFLNQFLTALKDKGGEDKILTIEELRAFMEQIEPVPLMGSFGHNEEASDFLFIAK